VPTNQNGRRGLAAEVNEKAVRQLPDLEGFRRDGWDRSTPMAPVEEFDVDNEQATQESAQVAKGDSTPVKGCCPSWTTWRARWRFGDTKASLLLTADSILLAAIALPLRNAT
jgi:hypothetical protein